MAAIIEARWLSSRAMRPDDGSAIRKWYRSSPVAVRPSVTRDPRSSRLAGAVEHRCEQTAAPHLLPVRNYTDADGLPGFLIDVIDHKHDGGRDVTAVM